MYVFGCLVISPFYDKMLLFTYTVEFRYLELGYLEFCEFRSVYLSPAADKDILAEACLELYTKCFDGFW